MATEYERKQECPYNKEALCLPSKRQCDTCGWNPEVAKQRLEKILEQRTGLSYADRCVCCGAIIPEGRQVCPACEGGKQGANT